MRGALARLAGVLIFFGVIYGGRWLLRLHVPDNLAVAGITAFAAYLLVAFVAGMIAPNSATPSRCA